MVNTTIHREKSLLVNAVKSNFKPVTMEQFATAKINQPAIVLMKKWLLWLLAV